MIEKKNSKNQSSQINLSALKPLEKSAISSISLPKATHQYKRHIENALFPGVKEFLDSWNFKNIIAHLLAHHCSQFDGQNFPFETLTHLPFCSLSSCLWGLVKSLFEFGTWTWLYHEGLAEVVSLETFGDVSLDEEFVGIFVKFFRCQFVDILLRRRNDFNVHFIAVNRALSGWGSGFSFVRGFVDSVLSKACTHWKLDILYEIYINMEN